MKQYSLKLKGTRINNNRSIDIIIFGENKGQAFNWAYDFFQKGEFVDAYYPANIMGTADFIPNAPEMTDLAGKYFVPKNAVSAIK